MIAVNDVFKHNKTLGNYKVVSIATYYGNRPLHERERIFLCYSLETDPITRGLYLYVSSNVSLSLTAEVQAALGPIKPNDSVVIYQNIVDQKVWARSKTEFLDGRFLRMLR